jgi:hypothetical protein
MSSSDAMREKKDTQTSLQPILVALEHIEAFGSLLAFTHDHPRRVRLMKVMTEIELVAWNAVTRARTDTVWVPMPCRASRDPLIGT